MDEHSKTFGERLRWYARRYYGTLRAFGEVVGRSPSDMTRAVRGVVPGGRELAEWQEKTGVSPTWLLSGVGPERVGADRPDTGASGSVRDVGDVYEVDAGLPPVDMDVYDLDDPAVRRDLMDNLEQRLREAVQLVHNLNKTRDNPHGR